jgi:RNA polymerase sigma-70 factor (ECF subfamily)
VDEEAELLRSLYPGLRRLAGACGPIDVEPEDLVQEAVTRALRRGPLTNLDDPGAYLRRAIINLASNRRRGLHRWHLALRRHGAAVPETDGYPSDLSELLRLAPLDRAILFLVDVEDASYADAARSLGCSEDAARQRASRARRRLRELLEGAP